MIKNKAKIGEVKSGGKLVIYGGAKGGVELRADEGKETIWARQEQIAELFNVDRTVATKHIKNILADKELNRSSVCANFAHTAKDGKQYSVIFYNLDLILAIGYRTNSAKAIKFRQWATKILRGYLLRGFSIDKDKIKKTSAGFDDLREAVDFIESKAQGRVRGTVTIKLKKELI